MNEVELWSKLSSLVPTSFMYPACLLTGQKDGNNVDILESQLLTIALKLVNEYNIVCRILGVLIVFIFCDFDAHLG